ncbi:MAG: hypothetical protein IJ099_03505 [Alphaproteobacteria bacterium]|nr:hypothetical protein [Alphaproteobacteria bacterium]
MKCFMRFLCIWSSISIFTYTEILPPAQNIKISEQIEQLFVDFADSWTDGALL